MVGILIRDVGVRIYEPKGDRIHNINASQTERLGRGLGVGEEATSLVTPGLG